MKKNYKKENMLAEEFKTNAITLLKYCLEETKRCAKEDGLENEELELSNSYCDGLRDAIKKIEKLPVK